MSEKRRTPKQVEMQAAKQLMKRLLMAFRGRLDDELRPRDVTAAQLKLLDVVREHPGTSGAELARSCYVTPQTAQAMLSLAVKRGWVARGKDARNGRLVTASLTAAGERLLAEAGTIVEALEAELWRGVGVAELGAMNRVMERGLRNLQGDEKR